MSTIKANLGAVKNAGAEFQLNGQLLDRRVDRVGHDDFNASHNSNKLVTLGKDPKTGDPIPPIINTTTRQLEGYPINGYWQRPYTWSDSNNDGIITPDEVTVATTGGPRNDGFQFIGYSQPRDEVSIKNGFELLKRRSCASAHSSTTRAAARCSTTKKASSASRPRRVPKRRSLESKRGVRRGRSLQRDTPALTQWGYFEKLQFWRFRELTATYNFPDNLAARYLRSQAASITLGARNLHVWTQWTAADPEQNYSQGDTQITLLTAGPPRTTPSASTSATNQGPASYATHSLSLRPGGPRRGTWRRALHPRCM